MPNGCFSTRTARSWPSRPDPTTVTIVWVNGTFGAGKTTTGTLVADADPRLRVFDPEWVGYLLRANLSDLEVTDFQHYPSWRRLVPVVMDEVVAVTGQQLVAIQSVLVEDYWHEILSGLRALGHEVLHVVLEADDTAIRRRIDADEVEARARDWRIRHLDVYARSRAWMVAAADLVLDTTSLTPEQAADQVLALPALTR